jgi:hypothetical protein
MNIRNENRKRHFVNIGELLGKYDKKPDHHVSQEFQQYGYDLAQSLGDMKHKALYIKLAKETPRGLLESARSFVMDAANAKSKGRLFMWKLSQLRAKSENTKEENKDKNL